MSWKTAAWCLSILGLPTPCQHYQKGSSRRTSANACWVMRMPAMITLGELDAVERCRACCCTVQFDEEMAARAQEAEAAGQKLVYVGLVEVAAERCTVGLKVSHCGSAEICS